MRTLTWATCLAAVLVLAFVAVGHDAALRRAAQNDRAVLRTAAVRLLGTADLFLSSSSRWIRHLSWTEPGAAFADGPALLDPDPAGAIVGPAPALWVGWGASLSPRRGR